MKRDRKHSGGYSLLEVLIAATVLMVGVAAAGFLALASVTQEEMSARISRALNQQEQAARLFQLGMSPSEISALLPPDPAILSLTFTVNVTNVPGVGPVEEAECVIVFKPVDEGDAWAPFTWTAGRSDSTPSRTNSITVLRPSIR
jgi:Tfp pilus assembly protein PilV